MLDILFWVSAIGAVFSYFIYPILLMIIGSGKQVQDFDKQFNYPSITVIIPAYNEADRIAEKLDNTLAAAYPMGKREIIIASDASTDATDNTVTQYASKGVKLVRADARHGKEFAQALAISAATGEIIVFTDVSTTIAMTALQDIVKAFSNPKVGAVSSEDRIVGKDGQILGEGAYVRYEMWLRRLESRVNSLVGLSGNFFAARKVVCNNWDPALPGDFNTAINCHVLGYKAITDSSVLGYYPDIQNERREYQRKLRTVVHGISSVLHRLDILNPARYGLFAMQIWGHKLMRWLVPWFLVLLLISSMLLLDAHWIYRVALYMQLFCYLMALLGWQYSTKLQSNVLKIPYFFVQVNLAIAHAWILYMRGERMATWEPTKR